MAKESKPIIILVFAAFILRMVFVFFFHDLSREEYWEYGEIARNLHMGNGYSLFYDDGSWIAFRALPHANPFPSAYMMPGYVMLLYPFFFFNDPIVRNVLILLLQGLIGAGAVLLTFRFADRHFGRREAFVASTIMACLPEFIYATGSYTPTVVSHVLILALLPFLYEMWSGERSRAWMVTGVLFAALAYVRPETFLFETLYTIALFFRGRRREALGVGCTLVLLLLPWQVRNEAVFNRWIPFTTSEGLNFFRGHNDSELGAFGDDEINRGLRGLPRGAEFEPGMNRLYFGRAWQCIAADPAQEFGRTGNKLLQLWFRDANDPRAANLLYLGPWLILLAAGLIGIVRRGAWRRHWILILYLGASTVVAVAFFVLPRYQTMMKVALIPFAASGLVTMWDAGIRQLKR